jgi:endonuclease III
LSKQFPAARTYYERERPASRTRRARSIIKDLFTEFPDPACALLHTNPFELLISTILSAQSTDQQVNKVTPLLFKEYPSAEALAEAPMEHVMELIHSTGFYKNKAKSIINCSAELVQKYDAKVPTSMNELVALPGVGRKTANVVLGNAFGIPGLPVDTHVNRISNLLALTVSDKPEVIEKELCAMIPESNWTDASHLLILHGRKTCIARRPQCISCIIEHRCPSSTLKTG